MGVSRTARARTSIALLLLVLSSASAAWAQAAGPAASALEAVVVSGTTVWVTDSTGREEERRVVGITGAVLTARAGGDVRSYRIADLQRVRVRESDAIWNGALIGAGTAVASGLLLCRTTEPWRNCRDDVGPLLRIGAIGAGIGIGIDALIRRRTTVYEAPSGATRIRAAPILARHARGVQVSLSF